MKEVLGVLLGVLVQVCLLAAPVHATLITGAAVATQVTAEDVVPQGVEVGWYKYTVNISWEFAEEEGEGEALSFSAFLLQEGCAGPGRELIFDTISGYSTSETSPEDTEAVTWFGALELNGGSTSKELEGIPLIKYEQHTGQSEEPGVSGSGTSWFYSNIIPQNGSDGEGATWENGLFALTGGSEIFGDFTGDGPSCTIIPEPATICLLGLSGLALVRKRKT